MRRAAAEDAASHRSMAEAAARNIDGADISVDGGEYDDDLAGSDPSDVDESLPPRGAWAPE